MLAPLLLTVSFLDSADISLDPLQDFVQVGYELFERSSFSLLVGPLYINIYTRLVALWVHSDCFKYNGGKGYFIVM